MAAEDVRQRVKAILVDADLDTLSERQIRNQIAKEFGDKAAKQHIKLIASVIEEFLDQQASTAAGGQGSDDTEQDGRKRSAEDEPEHAAKKAKIGEKSVSGNELILALSGRKKLHVRTFKGRALVDLREYWVDKSSGEEKPGASGLSLAPEQWAKLAESLPTLAAAQDSGDDSVCIQLSDQRRAYVSEFKGKYGVQVREYYDAGGGEMKPTKKGVNLDADSLATVIAHAPEVSKLVARLAPGSGSSSGGAAAAAPAQQPAAGSGKGAAGSSAAAAGAGEQPAAGAAATAAAAGGGDAIDLGQEKRVTLSKFKSEALVDLREWYRKGDQVLPGKKGISLKVSDWKTVCDHLDAINQALQAKDMAYALRLSSRRKVSLSEFKGKLYVGVREFYEKDGEEMPGAKGLSMTTEQWQRLTQGAAAFNTQHGL